MANHFVLSPTEYERRMGIFPEYRSQCAWYLSKMEDIDFKEASDFIANEVRTKRVVVRDPKVTYIAKNDVGDRYIEETTLRGYMESVVKDNRIIVPILTKYTPVAEKESILGSWITENKKERAVYKEIEKEAEVLGNHEMAKFGGNAQNGAKFLNNSLSGSQGVPSQVIYSPTGHPTLTSVCRILTSSANAANEKLIMGNRHYYNPQVTLNNIIAITEKTRAHPVREVIDALGLVLPTVGETMQCIRHSTQFYWHDEEHHSHIEKFIAKLDGYERAYFCYNADLFQVARLNPEFARGFFNAIIDIPDLPAPDSKEIIKAAASDLIETCSAMWSEKTKGTTLKKLAEDDPTGYGLVASAAKSVEVALDKYKDFIKTILRTDLICPSFASIASQYRRAVPTSDTDSTIYTAAYWVKWFTGHYGFSNDSYKIGYTVSFLVNQAIVNTLAIISTNLGVTAPFIHNFKMKNEFYFPVYMITQLAKHYIALQSAREGNVFASPKLEKKGVNLRNAATAEVINKLLEDFMMYILTTILNGGQLDLDDIRNRIADIEKTIYDNVVSGGSDFLKVLQIKGSDSYSQRENAPAVKQWRLWQEIFAPKYGQAPELPYRAVSIGLSTNSPAKIAKWVSTIKDPHFAQRVTDYCLKYNVKSIATLRLPEDIISDIGLPEEVFNVVELRSIVKMIVAPFYLLVSGLGYTILNKNGSYMFSDDWFGEQVIRRDMEFADGGDD